MTDLGRVHPHVNVKKLSPNCSSREGAHPSLIVVHATAGHNRPGVADLQSLGEWFSHESTQASSHVATDNEGHSARFVPDDLKAWHVCAFNRMSLGVEQVIPGDGTELTEHLYRETARWIARWSKAYAIPIRKGRVHGGYVTTTGVVRHSDLGVLGCNHNDPGPGYDLHHVLELARAYRREL